MTNKIYAIENDPYNFMNKTIFSKWKPYIIKGIYFDGGSTRFSRFTKQLPITEKVLSQSLRELEEDGIITRTIFPEVPVRVEYSLTELGKSIIPILDLIYNWGWNVMNERNIKIDTLGEMWHGYKEKEDGFMIHPFKKI